MSISLRRSFDSQNVTTQRPSRSKGLNPDISSKVRPAKLLEAFRESASLPLLGTAQREGSVFKDVFNKIKFYGTALWLASQEGNGETQSPKSEGQLYI